MQQTIGAASSVSIHQQTNRRCVTNDLKWTNDGRQHLIGGGHAFYTAPASSSELGPLGEIMRGWGKKTRIWLQNENLVSPLDCTFTLSTPLCLLHSSTPLCLLHALSRCLCFQDRVFTISKRSIVFRVLYQQTNKQTNISTQNWGLTGWLMWVGETDNAHRYPRRKQQPQSKVSVPLKRFLLCLHCHTLSRLHI